MDIHWKNGVLFCGQRTRLTGQNVIRLYKQVFFSIIEKLAIILVHIPVVLINPVLQSRIRAFSHSKL